MKTYIATSQNSKKFYSRKRKSKKFLGELIYPKWYSTKAEIHIGSKNFKTDTKGFGQLP